MDAQNIQPPLDRPSVIVRITPDADGLPSSIPADGPSVSQGARCFAISTIAEMPNRSGLR